MEDKEITIRTACPEDAQRLLEIYAPYVQYTAITFEYEVPTVEEFRKRIVSVLETYPYLVAENDGEMVGYAYVSPFKERAAYDWAVETSIYVDRNIKGCGIGGKLYAALERVLKSMNILNVNACIAYPEVEDEYLTNNSVEFHKHLGYQMVGEFHQCGYKFNRWYNMVWLEKMIGEHQCNPKPVIRFRERPVMLFDVDGVLLDSMSIWDNSANRYLKDVFGIDAPAEVDKNCATLSLLEAGAYIRSLYPEISLTPMELADGVAAYIREKYIRAEGKSGMTEVIRILHESGWQLYLATASDRNNVKGALVNLGVWDYFSDIFTCTEIGYSKRYTQYYDAVAKRVGVEKERLVMVEDSLHSMQTAKKAGLTVAGIYEESSRDDWDRIKQICDVHFHNLSEMLDWVPNI